MHDRGTQALAKMALEPEWEAKFEPNSFGFRPGRSCQDAIRQIYNVINLQPRYVLDADIASCFDKIDHAALLEKMATSPFFARPIRQWLKAGVVDQETFMPTQEGTPQGGVLSPPTKLQTFFFGIVITRIWVDSKYDIDLVTRDFHPLDQRPDEVALARPIGGLQAVVEFGRKVLQPANNQLQFPLHSGLIGQCLALLLEASEAVAQAGHPGCKLSPRDKTLRITMDQSGDALAQLADLAFNGGQRGTFRTRLRLQAAAIFFREPLGMGEQRTDFLPDCQVQQVGPHLRILTEPLAAKAIRIRAQAAVIGIRAGLACTGTRAEAFAIEGIATVLALAQPLQQRQGTPARLACMPLVVLQLCLDGCEHFGLHECWDRNRDPVLWWDIADGDGTTRLHGPVALGAQPGPHWLQASRATRRGALRGWILHDAPYDPPIPHGPARAGHLTRLGQPATDLPNRQAVLAHPGKDLADDAGFVRDDLIAGLPAPFIFGHIA